MALVKEEEAGLPAGVKPPNPASEPSYPVGMNAPTRPRVRELAPDEICYAPNVNEYLRAMVRDGPSTYIDNARVEMRILSVDGEVVPLVITEPGRRNSDVCSAHSHYVGYTLSEISKRHSRLLRPAFTLASAAVGLLLDRCRIDRAVYVNNWLLTTNPVPSFSPEQVRALTAYLCESYPDHAIVHRTVNPVLSPEHYRGLCEAGYRMVRSRIVYVIDPRSREFRHSESVRRDRLLLKRTPYAFEEGDPAGPAEVTRMTELYRSLYLDKHCHLNPHFNERFFALVMRTPFFMHRLLKASGRTDALLVCFINDGRITGSVIGYDLSEPRELGLYRLVMIWKLLLGEKLGLAVNLSGGVGHFKRCRGARPLIEYEAVYDRHLPPWRRLAWRLVELQGHCWTFPSELRTAAASVPSRTP